MLVDNFLDPNMLHMMHDVFYCKVSDEYKYNTKIECVPTKLRNLFWLWEFYSTSFSVP